MRNNFLKYLNSLSKEELIDLIYHPYRKTKKIDFLSYRKIALKISYNGLKYSGLAEYKYGDTVGNHIKNALLMSTLGENIVYAGRTDKGVSAVNMIGSLTIKSLLPNSSSRYFLTDDDKNELDYSKLLNNYLPDNIKILGWAPVESDFNARFSCIQRKYRYYFKGDGYDIDNMQKMCDYIKNLKNFYNFSKHSDENAKYDRTIETCRIEKDEDLFYLDIRARSFLHNMVRKIFWTVEKAGKNQEVDYEKIGTADADNLIFCEAVYPVKLTFLTNKLHLDTWEKEYQRCIVKHKIQKLIFESQL